MTQKDGGGGLNQVMAVCAVVPTFSGRSIWIRRCVERANSPLGIDFLATAVPNRIAAAFAAERAWPFDSHVTPRLPRCDSGDQLPGGGQASERVGELVAIERLDQEAVHAGLEAGVAGPPQRYCGVGGGG